MTMGKALNKHKKLDENYIDNILYEHYVQRCL